MFNQKYARKLNLAGFPEKVTQKYLNFLPLHQRDWTIRNVMFV